MLLFYLINEKILVPTILSAFYLGHLVVPGLILRGPYFKDSDGEARLPGVNGETPMLVEGSSVLVTFSASYWGGVGPAGEDYGWRLVCFTTDGGTSNEAEALVGETKRAADRAEAVDAVNILG